MDEYLRCRLDLQIKPNWQVFPVDARGVDFVGYRFFHGYKLLRKTTCKKFKKKMVQIQRKQADGNTINYSEWCSANSYDGLPIRFDLKVKPTTQIFIHFLPKVMQERF